jgi:formylglycine-generating enzyme
MSIATRLLLSLVLTTSAMLSCGSKSDDDEKSSKDKDDDDDESSSKKSKKASSASAAATESAAPSATTSASAAPAETGQVVTVPAGKVIMGHSCGAVPRVTDEELMFYGMDLSEFTIDKYPYPNDPMKPITVNVSASEASDLCKAAGKRLCTEVEWERACKGPTNTVFEYAGNYDKKACETLPSLMPGQRPKCESGFAVKDMHGLAFEWTDSAWGRGQSSSLRTVRGFKGGSDVVRERCASGKGVEPGTKNGDIGFRCCGGNANSARVDLAISRPPVLVEERPSVELARDLLKAMPPDHQQITDHRVSIDKVWRWHPRDNEELLIARWQGAPTKSRTAFFELAVFKVCGGVPTRIQRMRGPVGKIESVRESTQREKITIEVSTKRDKGKVDLNYWYGSVGQQEPAWLKAGNKLDLDEKEKDDKDRTPVKKPPLKRLPKK